MVVETLSQDEPSLTALSQEADHQTQDRLEGIMGIGGKKMSLGGDHLSSSPRDVRLQKSAAHAVLSRSKDVAMKLKNKPFWGGGFGAASTATVVAGLVTMDRLEGS